MNTFVSVLLPLYNAEQSLAQCLDSILSQTHANFEVIAVDDGSTDSSAAILSRYTQLDFRIKPHYLPENRGIVSALNAGLEKCQGKWVARMDADDLMHNRRLELQLKYIIKNPSIDILGCRINLFRYQGELSTGQLKYRDWSNSLLTDAEIKSNIFAESPIMHPTFFLSLETYKKMGGYADNPWAEDYDFLLRAFLNGFTFGKLTENLVDKGDHPTRLARTDFRCKRPAMFAAKAHYFVRVPSLWQDKKQILVVGTGSAGRMTYQALSKEGFEIAGFVDNKGGEEREIYGKPVLALTRENAREFLSEQQKTLFLFCIGVEEGRKLAEKIFSDQGYESGKDFIRFI